ncbi:MAG: oligosaccharide flippase family protein [Barnesiella sp.]
MTVICQLLSVNLFFATINIVPNALIYKRKEFKYIAGRTFFVQISTGILAIFSVYLGAGIYALVVNPVLSSVFIFILNIRRYPQTFRWHLDMEPVRKISNYSLYQFLFNLLNYAGKNMDKLIIGKYGNGSVGIL